MKLELKGINYDIGTFWSEGQSSRPNLDESIIKQEMAVIAKKLHCNAVRISGQDIDLLNLAAGYAIENGLKVWLSPALINATEEEIVPYLTKCAQKAAALLSKGDVTFVVGCEWTIFLHGLLPGTNLQERVKKMASPFVMPMMVIRAILRSFKGKDPRLEVVQLNHLLGQVVDAVRAEFPGKVTYAAGEWEEIDWQPFDIVSIDYYRTKESRITYGNKLAVYKNYDKPVVVTEFGCCTFKGADKKGGSGWQLVNWHNGKATLKEGLIRSEQVQSEYLKEQLDIFEEQKITGAFVYTFINPTYLYSSNPRIDLDMASYGIVKPVVAEGQHLGAVSWQPKAAFTVLADCYRNHSQ